MLCGVCVAICGYFYRLLRNIARESIASHGENSYLRDSNQVKKRFLEKLRKIMKFFLPLLFITYLGGITLFTHSHVVNGVIIVHSHPFKGAHEHTEVQLETIFYLSSFITSSVPELLTAALAFLFLLCVLRIPAVERIKCVKPRSGISLRAPPFPF